MRKPPRNPDDDRPRYTEDAIRESMSRDTLNRPPEEPPTFKIKLTRKTREKVAAVWKRLFG